jgi:hypothetical protein
MLPEERAPACILRPPATRHTLASPRAFALLQHPGMPRERTRSGACPTPAWRMTKCLRHGRARPALERRPTNVTGTQP